MRLNGKVALITGASSGIGRATAILFAKEGAKVIVVANRNVKGGEETVKDIKEEGGEAIFVKADVSKAADVEKMVKKTVEKYGKIDILFNNAGIMVYGTVIDTSEEEWDRILNIDLKSIFLCSKYAIPEMIKQGGGVIINTASTFGLSSASNVAAYCAAKGGNISLTKAMAIDHAVHNIRVNCICPGSIITPMLEREFARSEDPERLGQSYIKIYPAGRLGKPEDVAHAALFLASNESSFITGSTLTVDGGIMAQNGEEIMYKLW